MLSAKQGMAMVEISKAAIGRRAVELAEGDGFAWLLDYQPIGTGSKRFLKVLDEAGQQKYLALAREQLEREAGSA
jgi:hypothetical protein